MEEKWRFGETLRKLRKTKKLSLEAVGKVCGVTRKSVSKWELDINVPNVEHILKMCLLFGVTPNEIFENFLNS